MVIVQSPNNSDKIKKLVSSYYDTCLNYRWINDADTILSEIEKQIVEETLISVLGVDEYTKVCKDEE